MMAALLDPAELLRDMVAAALEAVSPQHSVPAALAPVQPIKGRTLVLCIGKAAAQMAQVAEETLVKTLGPDGFSGIVVTKKGNEEPLQHLATMTAGHPHANKDSVRAAQALMDEVSTLTPQDRLIVLMSGGASALTLLPAQGLTFDDVAKVNAELLRGGVPIDKMNIVRRHISAFNGGRLARAANGAEILTLAVSDVPGDGPEIIGSGPTAPDTSTFADALKVMRDYSLVFPAAVLNHLKTGMDESVKPDDPLWRKTTFKVIASNRHAMQAAADYAQSKGVKPVIIDEPICGDAAAEATLFAEIARTRTYKGNIIHGPAVLLRGGEAIVKLPANFNGKGGRVGHAALSYLIANPDSHAIFAATDGSDGTSGHAAIQLSPDTMGKAIQSGLDTLAAQRGFTSAAFFDALGGAMPERPTGTNVNELYIAFLP